MIENISMFFVLSGFICALLIAFYLILKDNQKMKIMNYVWTLTGLWANWFGLFTYFKIGKNFVKSMDMPNMKMDVKNTKSLGQQVVISTLHCGAGCTLADIIGEWLTVFYPVNINNNLIAGQWTLDYFLALIIGIAFQYFAIKSMENLSIGKTIFKAFKIDFFSLTSWQIGMYGFMAIIIFIFNNGETLTKTTWTFWFVMQIAMLCGFLTAYPTNWILIKLGIKKVM